MKKERTKGTCWHNVAWKRLNLIYSDAKSQLGPHWIGYSLTLIRRSIMIQVDRSIMSIPTFISWKWTDQRSTYAHPCTQPNPPFWCHQAGCCLSIPWLWHSESNILFVHPSRTTRNHQKPNSVLYRKCSLFRVLEHSYYATKAGCHFHVFQPLINVAKVC